MVFLVADPMEVQGKIPKVPAKKLLVDSIEVLGCPGQEVRINGW